MQFYDGEVTIVYKNGAVIKVDGLKSFSATIIGDNNKAEWVHFPWAKNKIMVFNPNEVCALFHRHRRLYSPFKIFRSFK